MSSYIILQDGRAWFNSNRAFEGVLRRIAAELRDIENGADFGNWLSDKDEVNMLLTYGLDVRGLTENNQKTFCAAVKKAVAASKAKGSVEWADPSFFPEWMEHFERLERMILAIERKEPPQDLNDLSKVIDRSPKKIGPGWA